MGFFLVFVVILGYSESKACTIPENIRGSFYYMYEGASKSLNITESDWEDSKCQDRYDHPNPGNNTDGGNHTFIVKHVTSNTCSCVDVLWRTPNVLQFRRGDSLICTAIKGNAETTCEGVQRLPDVHDLTTLFRTENKVNVSCKTMFEGTYQFTYEMNFGSGGVCDNPDNRIEYCDDDSQHRSTFRMTYRTCLNISSSANKGPLYDCYGTWLITMNADVYKYAVIANESESDSREKYKCLMTLQHKEMPNKELWTMSRFSDCARLHSEINGPVRLVLTKTANCTVITTEISSTTTSTSTSGPTGTAAMSKLAFKTVFSIIVVILPLTKMMYIY